MKKSTKQVKTLITEKNPQYGGFLSRALAALIDCAIIGIFCMPLFTLLSRLIFGDVLPADIINIAINEAQAKFNNLSEVNLRQLLNFIVSSKSFQNYFFEENGIIKIILNLVLQIATFVSIVLIFWFKKQATIGMMILSIKIVDAKTYKKPSKLQFVIRILGYLIAALPAFLGIIWISFDPKKQGWHDKIASTLVVKNI